MHTSTPPALAMTNDNSPPSSYQNGSELPETVAGSLTKVCSSLSDCKDSFTNNHFLLLSGLTGQSFHLILTILFIFLD